MARSPKAAAPLEARIREIAHKLWLDEGQPEGKAEAHWGKAEEIAKAELKPARKAPAKKAVPAKTAETKKAPANKAAARKAK